MENQQNMSNIFCDKDMIEYILPEASSIKNIGILCNFDLGSFIEDLSTEFNLNWINKTVSIFKLKRGYFNTKISS